MVDRRRLSPSARSGTAPRHLARAVYGWIERVLSAGRIIPPTDRLGDHVYERFLPPPGHAIVPLMPALEVIADGLDRLDPVCLMDVDPSTTRHTGEYLRCTAHYATPSPRG